MAIRLPEEERLDINLTPVIDVVFLLLIFFLVATKFADIERDVRVHPPSSQNARPVTAIPSEIVINVASDGTLLLAGHERTLDEIDRLLKAATKTNPHQSVIIRGDRDSDLHFAVNILDLCEKHHVERTFLTTRQTDA